MTDVLRERVPAHVIVLGNEKGGSGKTTTAMHVIAYLLQTGFRVGSIDLDGRQRSLTRYVENRKAWAEAANVNLVMPDHAVLTRSAADTVTEANAAEEAELDATIERLAAENDFLVIDCPGSDKFARFVATRAHTLVTPINDSFVDFDLIGQVDPETFKVKKLSFYAELIWEARKARAKSDGTTIDWVVLRNRTQHVEAHNMKRIVSALAELSQRVGFRMIPGLSERVIYRELFPSGLTIARSEGRGRRNPDVHVSRCSAREVRALVEALQLPV